MSKEVVSKEQAELEFNEFLFAMGLEDALADMDNEEQKASEKNKSIILRAIQQGRVTFNENHEAVFETTPHKDGGPSTTLVFHERTGADLMASDGIPDDCLAKKTYAVLASMCKTHIKTFATMRKRDLDVVQAISAFLMV